MITKEELGHWFAATRPNTLPASVAPIMLGAALSYRESAFRLPENFFLLISLIVAAAILIQVSTNFVNDLYDFKKGADTETRRGPTRAVQAGHVSERQMLVACLLVNLLIVSIGSILVYFGGMPILIIGIFSILFAVLYTAGPYPLAYLGLGEVFVLVFFGPIPVWGTYYLLTGTSSYLAIILGVAPGLISSAILAANNLRDIEEDRLANKKTLAVRGGTEFAKLEFALLHMLSFVPCILLAAISLNWFFLLPILIAPISIKLSASAYSKTSSNDQIALLKKSGQLLLAHCALTAASILLA